MFGNKESDEDMKAFEARLASLRPRADRLDPHWRSLLAKEASLTAETELPSPIGREAAESLPSPRPLRGARRGAGGEGEPGCAGQPPFSPPALTLALSQRERGHTSLCDNPAGHRFVCVRCGSEATLAVARRWPWPAAFSAMTCAAAVLLVMLVTQRAPSGSPAGSPLGATAGLSGSAPSSFNRVEYLGAEQPAPDADEDTMSYLRLREQVFRHGVAWLDRPLPKSAVPMIATEKPLTNRELLDRLIEEQGLRGS